MEVERKFEEIYEIDDYEILTDDGWTDIHSIGKTIPYEVWEIKLHNGYSLKAADTHILFSNGEEVYLKDLQIGNMIDTDKGLSEIISIENLGYTDNMYDLQTENHKYYSNGILSHNSTIIAIYALWYSIFFADKTIGIVSNKEASAKDILHRIKIMYEDLPTWLKPGVSEYSKTFITFDNGSRIIVSATSEDAFRGRTLNLLVTDEFAFVRKNIAEAFWAANYPTISASTEAKICIISTPNGIFGLFHQLYTQAERGENEFKHLRVSWRDVPGRDDEWAKQQLKNLGKTRFSQEFSAEFLGSTNTLIDTITLETLFSKYSEEFMMELQGKFKVYEKPISGFKYVLGVDSATGSGEDFSSIQVLKILNLRPIKIKQVGVYHNNQIDVYNFSEVVNRIALYYNQAYIMCESNAEGSVVVNNLWWEFENAGLINYGNKNHELGIKSTRKTKPAMVLYMKKLIESGQLELFDRETVEELGAFVEENGRFFGKDINDDLVSSLYMGTGIFQKNVLDETATLKIRDEKKEDDDVWGILSGYDQYQEDWSSLISRK